MNILKTLHLKNTLPVSLLSQLTHLMDFKLREPKTKLDKGMLIFSIDIDVGNAEVGLRAQRKNKRKSRGKREYLIGKLEEEVIPLFLELFDDYMVPVTFGVRGESLEVNNSIMDVILNSSVKHDVGAHGYTHEVFTKLSRDDADLELKMIAEGMKKFGIVPRSFVFPKNHVAHLDLLPKYGYYCYRSSGGFIKDSMRISKSNSLYDIHPSLYIDQYANPIFLRSILNISITNRSPFHIWFHLWNFGETYVQIRKNIRKWLFPLLEYAEKNVENGNLTFGTMFSAAEKMEELSL